MYDYGYGYGYTDYGYADYDAAAGLLGGMAAFFGIMMILSLAIGIVSLISQWKIYKKAGKGGWECLIPVYNIIVLLQIVELPMWYIALFFVPIANIYAIFKIYIELAHKFGKSTGFGVATVFFNFICLPILAFDKNNNYQGGSNTNNNQTNTNFVNSEIPTPPESNNINYNNSSVQEPILFNQNVNTDINPIPQVQNNDANMVNPVNVNPAPQSEQPIAFNPMTNATTTTNPMPAPQPVSLNTIPEQQTINTVPNEVNMQPVNNVQPQGLNVIPNMGPTAAPQMPNQNSDNNQNNPNM